MKINLKLFFFGETGLVEYDDLVFMIALEDLETNYTDIDLPEEIMTDATSIVESIRLVDSEAECLEKGGRWEVLGFSGPGCNLPSSDGGKQCTDSRDCESLCLANNDEIMVDNRQGILLSDPERLEDINAQADELEGICSSWKSTFGCYVIEENGKYMIICID